MCDLEGLGAPSILRLIRSHGCSLGEDVVDFDLGVQNSVEEMEQVQVCLHSSVSSPHEVSKKRKKSHPFCGVKN